MIQSIKTYWDYHLETNLRWLLVPLVIGSFTSRIFILPLEDFEHRTGLFELSFVAFLSGLVILFVRRRWPLHWHLLNLVVALMILAGLLSAVTLVLDVYYPYFTRLAIMLQQLAILVFFFLFSAALFNLFMVKPQLVGFLLRVVVVVAVFMIIWVMVDQLAHQENPHQYVGPFGSKRALLGLHMLSMFWLILVALFWPNRPAWERLLTFAALLLTVYAIVVAGRRSIYVASAVGFVGLAAGIMVAYGRDRRRLAGLLSAIGLLVLAVYLIGDRYFTQFEFFRYKLAQLTNYIAVKGAGGTSWEDPFLAGQIDGAIAAFQDYPLFGIGWGGFYESVYSPGGYEMHGTPQKFLAEMGIAGFLLYIVFSVYLMFSSLAHFIRLRRTAWGLPSLVFSLAMWSLPISYLYNRQLTDRAFWILLAIYLGFEIIASRQEAILRQSGGRHLPSEASRRKIASESAHSVVNEKTLSAPFS